MESYRNQKDSFHAVSPRSTQKQVGQPPRSIFSMNAPICLDARAVIHRPAAQASPGSLLELQNLRLHARPIESESVFEQDP